MNLDHLLSGPDRKLPIFEQVGPALHKIPFNYPDIDLVCLFKQPKVPFFSHRIVKVRYLNTRS